MPDLGSRWSWRTVWSRPCRSTADSRRGLPPTGGRSPAYTRHTERPTRCSAHREETVSKRDPSGCRFRRNGVLGDQTSANVSTNQATGFTLQLQGLLLELTTPLLSHVELSGGGKESSARVAGFSIHDNRSGRDNCLVPTPTTLCSRSGQFLSRHYITMSTEARVRTVRNTFSIGCDGVTLVTNCTPEIQRRNH